MAGSQDAEPGLAADAGFAERLLELIDSGRRTATYKLALLMALLDLCARRCDAAGRPPSVLYTREIAERVAAIYWPQVMAYRRGPEVIQLRQITIAALGDHRGGPGVPAGCRGEGRHLAGPWPASGWCANTRRCWTA